MCVCVCMNVCMYVCHIHTSSVTGVRGLQVVVRSISPVCVCVCVCVCAPVTFIFFFPLPPRSPSVLSLILFYCFNLSLCYFIIFLFNSPSDPRFCFSLFLYLPLPVTHGSVSPHADPERLMRESGRAMPPCRSRLPCIYKLVNFSTTKQILVRHDCAS